MGIEATTDLARDVFAEGNHLTAGRVVWQGLALHGNLGGILDTDRHPQLGAIDQAATAAGDQEEGAKNRDHWIRNGRNCELMRS